MYTAGRPSSGNRGVNDPDHRASYGLQAGPNPASIAFIRHAELMGGCGDPPLPSARLAKANTSRRSSCGQEPERTRTRRAWHNNETPGAHTGKGRRAHAVEEQ